MFLFFLFCGVVWCRGYGVKKEEDGVMNYVCYALDCIGVFLSFFISLLLYIIIYLVSYNNHTLPSTLFASVPRSQQNHRYPEVMYKFTKMGIQYTHCHSTLPRHQINMLMLIRTIY